VALVDVVVVSYNSRRQLRRCVEQLAAEDGVQVIVVDNASSDGSLEEVTDLPVRSIGLELNGGFATGCNAGWRAGAAPFVLFLNPDASIEPASIRRLVDQLEHEDRVGAAGPRIDEADGSLDYSQRRFPRLRSTYAQALFLHRVFPRSLWADETVRDDAAYARPGAAEWISGACMLVRRSALERLGGWDEGFFMYCEDKDLCRRLWDAGYEVRFQPEARCRHTGGASAPRSSLLPILASSRVRYAGKHETRVVALLERAGVALGAITHSLVARSAPMRAGHARSLLAAARPSRAR